MSQDSGFDSGSFQPLITERVAAVGEYAAKIEGSPFNQSRILKTAAFYVESGRFAEGAEIIQAELVKRGVGFEYVPKHTVRRGTRVEDGRETMILEDDFKDQHPARRLWSLVHRNMSLILQRSGKREDPSFTEKLLGMDIAYADAARLGAQRIQDGAERKSVQSAANDIELMTRQKILAMDRNFPQDR